MPASPTTDEMPGELRVVAPADARVVGIGGVGMMAVGEFGDDHPDLAEVAARDHRPHVADQRVAGIAVVDRADAAALSRACGRCPRLPRPWW